MGKMGRLTNGKRFKRLLAIVLSVLMLTSVIDLNGLVNVQASEIESDQEGVSSNVPIHIDGTVSQMSLDQAGYVASVTSAGTTKEYTDLNLAVNDALDNSGTLTLLQDTNTLVSIVDRKGMFTLDLNGHAWNSALSLEIGIVAGSLTVNIVECSGYLEKLNLGTRAFATIKGGTFGSIDMYLAPRKLTLSSLVPDEYTYRDRKGILRYPTGIEEAAREIQYVQVCKKPVLANANGVESYHNNLTEAVDYCYSTGATITLLDNISYGEAVSFYDNYWTIEFNGKKIIKYGMAIIVKGADLTLKDSAGNDLGGIETTESPSGAICICSDSTLNVESGSYTNTNGVVVRVSPDSGSTAENVNLRIRGGIFDSGNAVENQFTMDFGCVNSGEVIFSGGIIKGTGVEVGNNSLQFKGGSFSKLSKCAYNQYDSLMDNIREIEHVTIDGTRNMARKYCYDLGNGTKTFGAGMIVLNNVKVVPAPMYIFQHGTGPFTIDNAESDADLNIPLKVYAQKTDSAVGDIHYQWYHKSNSPYGDGYFVPETLIEGANEGTYLIKDKLEPGCHGYYCVVTCDGLSYKSNVTPFWMTRYQPIIKMKIYDWDDNEIKDGIGNTETTVRIWLENINGEPILVSNNSKDNYILVYGLNGSRLAYWDNTEKCYITSGSGYEISEGEHSVYAIFSGNASYKPIESEPITFNAVKIKCEQEPISNIRITRGLPMYGVGNGLEKGVIYFGFDGGSRIGKYTTVSENNGILESTNKNGRGPFKIIGTGKVVVTALVEGDYDYHPVQASKEFTITKADKTTVNINESFPNSYAYSNSELNNPTKNQIDVYGAYYEDVHFSWYKDTVSKNSMLPGPPSKPGTYVIVASIEENNNTHAANASKTVTISDINLRYKCSETPEPVNGWYGGDVIQQSYGYYVSDRVGGPFTGYDYTFTGEGIITKILYFKELKTGNIISRTVTVKIDRTPPDFSGEFDGIFVGDYQSKELKTKLDYKYFGRDLDVRVSATDRESGIKEYRYLIDTIFPQEAMTAQKMDERISLAGHYPVFTSTTVSSETSNRKYCGGTIYIYAVDYAGNTSKYICSDGYVIDKVEPYILLKAEDASERKANSAVVKVNSNDFGTVHYIVQSGSVKLSVSDILTNPNTKKIEIKQGQENTDVEIMIPDLQPNTTYIVKAVGTDKVGNVSQVVANTYIRTSGVHPKLDTLPTITGVYGQPINEMEISQNTITNGVEGVWKIDSTEIPDVGTEKTYDLIFTPNDSYAFATLKMKIKPTVKPRNLEESGVEIGEIVESFIYSSSAITPTLNIVDSEAAITNSDYKFSYRNNTNAGAATLIITGMGNYTGTVERNFEINKAPTPNISFPESSPVTFGDKLSESQLISNGSGKYGTFTWSNPDEFPTVSNNGYEVTFTPNAISELNYEGVEIIKQKIPLVVQKTESTVALKHKISAETSQDQLSRMVTLTATVQGKEGANSPTGKVQFWSGSEDLELIGEANIQNQVATFEWSVPIGQWFDVTAKYVGDDNYNEFESSTIKGYSQQIGQLEQVDVSTSQFVENGMVDRNTLVSLSTQMKGATIYYTTDGTTPNQKSSVYKSPIRLTKDTTIQAIVYKKGYQSSAVVSCDYKIKTYTISFDAMTDTPFLQDYTLYKGDYVDLSTLVKPVMEGYRFLGWYKGDVLFDPLQPISQNEYYEAWWTQADTLNAPGSNYAHNQDLLEGSIVRLYAQEQDSIIYYTLDGSVPTKDSMVYHQGIVLDKTVEGDQAITIKAIATKEGYINSSVATFTYMLREDKTVFGDILPQDFPYWEVPSELWIAGLNQLFVYTGKTIKPTVRVYDGKRLLKMYQDYTIAYRDNKEAGLAKVIIKFKGNYRGIRTYEYTIRPKPLTHDDIIASNPMVHVTGKIQKCLPVVSDHGRKLAYHKDGKKDYVVTYQSASQDASTIEAQNLFKAPGKYKITITGTKNYTGSIDVVETILDKQTQFMISKASVASIPKQTYTGNKITPELTVKYGKKKLTVNEDYTLRYANNTAVGTGTILIQGIGDYHGAKLVSFKIQGKNMRYVKVTDGWVSEYEYDPSSSTYEQEELILGYQKSSKAPIEEVSSKAYTIRYLKNQGVGTATAIFTGRPEFGFSGSFKKTFKIKPNTNFVNADIIFPEDVPYQKAGCYPKLSVSLNDVTLVEGRDYSVKYANHKAVCLDLASKKAPTITIQGKGNYKGSKQVKFKIHKASLEDMTMHAQDRKYTGKKNAFSTKVTICDQNGKILVPGKDYNKNLTYRINETVLTKTDVVADGDIIIVSATGINGYEGVLETTFKVIRKQQFIGSAKVSIPDQTYTGEYIKIQKKDITISVQKGKETILLTPNDYEIIGYTNNLSKGRATITLKGVGAYGGIKKVRFKIISKEIIQPERF